MSDASKPPAEGDDRRNLTTRQGHPVYDNQNQRTIGDRGPATLENYHFLEKMSHFDRERIPERVVHARGVPRVRLLRGLRQGRRRADRQVHPREALPGGGQAHRPRAALLDRGRRPRLLRGRPRPARLRGQVLHRGRQLGPGREQPRRLLHPRRDQVPRLHPLAEAGPGHVPPGAEPPARLHQPVARVAAHGDAALQPARHPRRLPLHAGLRREHLQVGQRRGRDRAREVPLDPQAGREVLDRGRRRGGAGRGPRPAHARTCSRRSSAATTRSGSCACRSSSDDEHPELDFDPLDDTKVWPENEFEPRPVGRMVLNRNVENVFAENEQIAFGTGVLVDGLDFSDDKMLVGRTFSYSDTQRYRVGPELPAAAGEPAQGAGRDQPARRPDGVRRGRPRREPARELRAVDHGRAVGGAQARPRRGRPGDRGPPDAQAHPAHERLQAGRPSATCVRRSGSATTWSPT